MYEVPGSYSINTDLSYISMEHLSYGSCRTVILIKRHTCFAQWVERFIHPWFTAFITTRTIVWKIQVIENKCNSKILDWKRHASLFFKKACLFFKKTCGSLFYFYFILFIYLFIYLFFFFFGGGGVRLFQMVFTTCDAINQGNICTIFLPLA